jgi:hypothetical protein
MAGTMQRSDLHEPRREPEPVGPTRDGTEGGHGRSEVDEALAPQDPGCIPEQSATVTRHVNYVSPEFRGREHLPGAGGQ